MGAANWLHGHLPEEITSALLCGIGDRYHLERCPIRFARWGATDIAYHVGKLGDERGKAVRRFTVIKGMRRCFAFGGA